MLKDMCDIKMMYENKAKSEKHVQVLASQLFRELVCIRTNILLFPVVYFYLIAVG
jgi:hypothetical protein